MNFLLLCIQSSVCCICVTIVKRLKIISFREFDLQDAKAWFPISFLLVSVIYTGSKSLVRLNLPLRPPPVLIVIQQFLSIPVYTIFKNLTIILIVRDLFVFIKPHPNSFLGLRGSVVVRRQGYQFDTAVVFLHGTVLVLLPF